MGDLHRFLKRFSAPEKVLLSLVCVVVGLVLVALNETEIRDSIRMASWKPASAKVTALRWCEKNISSSARRNMRYAIRGTYEYQADGRFWRGSRIMLDDDFSRELSLLKEVFASWDRAMKEGREVLILVDPAQPANSVGNRVLPVSVICWIGIGCLLMIFGVRIGLVGLWGVWRFLRTPAEKIWRPWHSDRLGANFRLWGTGLDKSFDEILPALVMLCFAAMFYSDEPSMEAIIALMFFVGGIFGIVIGARSFIRTVFFGIPLLRLDAWPIALGRTFSGTLRVSRLWGITSKQIRCTFSCLSLSSQTVPSSGIFPKRTYSEDILWRQVKAIATVPGSGGMPFEVKIPRKLPERLMNQNPRILWLLEVEADGFPLGFSAEFELPVYAVEESEQKRAATALFPSKVS